MALKELLPPLLLFVPASALFSRALPPIPFALDNFLAADAPPAASTTVHRSKSLSGWNHCVEGMSGSFNLRAGEAEALDEGI